MSIRKLLYWDTDVFLAYLNKENDRLPTIEAIFEEIGKIKEDKIITSVITEVEVAYIAQEKLNRILLQDEEERIDSLWGDISVIEIVEFNDEIAFIARRLIREGIVKGWRLRTFDAIQLATAKWAQATELNTYNLGDFKKYEEIIGIQIRTPYTEQPKLFSTP